jgi:hypothetical protein
MWLWEKDFMLRDIVTVVNCPNKLRVVIDSSVKL